MNAPLSPEQLKVFRDLDAERAEARSRSPERAVAPSLPEVLTVCGVGLDAEGQQQLQDLVQRSLCLTPRWQWQGADEAHAADVLLIDVRDPQAAAWAQAHSHWLARRAVVWLGQAASRSAHRALVLPVSWPLLPERLLEAFRAAPPLPTALIPRALQPHAPAVLVLSASAQARVRCQEWLEPAGHRVTLAAHAREGLAALHATHYASLVVCGTVPDLDKLRLVRRVRTLRPRLGSVHLLYLSLEDDALACWTARLCGFDAAYRFPATPQALRTLLAPLVQAGAAAPLAMSDLA